jgi:DNA polymerase III gamma/tau subunit
MNAFILVGLANDYLDDFKKKNKVPDYFVTVFEDFKIADSRSLQKSISLKLATGEKRMYIVSNPTIEAQNSLLKSLEELPEDTFVFFTVPNKEDLLPTVISRSKIIDLGGVKPQEEEIEKTILRYRSEILAKIKKDSTAPKTDFLKLKKLIQNYKLVKYNNVNKKLALDNSNFF